MAGESHCVKRTSTLHPFEVSGLIVCSVKIVGGKFKYVVTCQLAFRGGRIKSYLSCLWCKLDFKHRVNIKIYFKLQKNAKEAHDILTSVYDDNVVPQKIDYMMCERFKSLNEFVEGKEPSGRRAISKTGEKAHRPINILHVS